MTVKITDRISYIPSCDNPLSADVGIIKGDSKTYIDDGIKLHIFQLPSSHAKGSLGLEIDEELAFVGDAIGPAIKPGKLVYNTQLLFEEIRELNKLKASMIIQSHNMDRLVPKSEITQRLETIYAKRNGQDPYIEVDRYHD